MILSIYEVEARDQSGKLLAVVGVEATLKSCAERIAREVVLDRMPLLHPHLLKVEARQAVEGLMPRAGDDRRERDRIKRRQGRLLAKMARMPEEERRALLAALLRQQVPGRTAVVVRAGISAGPACEPSPLPLIPIKPRAVISDGALNLTQETV